MSAPHVRDSGSRASAICFNSSVRPKKGWSRARLLGVEVLRTVGLAGSRLGVVVLGFSFVQCEPFENEICGLARRLSSRSV